MKFWKSFSLSVLFAVFSVNILTAMGGKPIQDTPMKASKINVTDGEYLRFGNSTGGEKSMDTYIVTRVDDHKKTAEIYWQNLDLYAKQILPGHYTNYNSQHYKIDLQTGSLLYSSFYANLTNTKGLVHSEIIFDQEKSLINSLFEYWDGYELKKSQPKMTVRKGYPVIDMNLITYICRFLDVTGPGIVYLCQPNVLREPIPFSFSFIGRETVRTPAGEFKTVKVAINIADPFLAKLLTPYAKELMIWIEDSPRMLFVKGVYAGGWTFMLEEVSNIKEMRME